MEHSHTQESASVYNQHAQHPHAYPRLAMMAILSFICMYFLMYAMVDSYANVVMNINQFYMAGLMTAPMVIIEILLMRSMYRNQRLNVVLILVSLVALTACFLLIRKQTAVGDKQFLKSMIPHHAGAVLMVKEAELSDPEVIELAKNIIESQEKEIAFMKAKIEEMEK